MTAADSRSRSAAASRSRYTACSAATSCSSRSHASLASSALSIATAERLYLRVRAAGASNANAGECARSPNSPGLEAIRSAARRRSLARRLCSPLMISSRRRWINNDILSCAGRKISGLLHVNRFKSARLTLSSFAASTMLPKCRDNARAAASSLMCARESGLFGMKGMTDHSPLFSVRTTPLNHDTIPGLRLVFGGL